MQIKDLKVGDLLPERSHTPTNVTLFMYNAAVWNPHRIHYDAAYTSEVEKHPGIVIDGPLQGDWLSQCVLNWLGDAGDLVRFAYSNRRAAYLGETLVTGGTITTLDASARSAEIELRVTNERGEVTTPGSAAVKLHA